MSKSLRLPTICAPLPRYLDAASTALADIARVLLVNVGFSHHPDLDWFWSLLVGGVLALRDLAQRRWGHALLMLIGAGLSFRFGPGGAPGQRHGLPDQ